MDEPLNVIIPLGGLGKRFADEGYIHPKPLIRVLGKTIIKWVLDGLELQENDALYIIYHNNLQKANFEDVVLRDFPNVTFCKLLNDTRGAAETVLKCVEIIPSSRMEFQTVCFDGDTFYKVDIIEKVRSISNGVICFQDRQEKPIYSYISVNENGQIEDIAEKKRISNFANTGCYTFESANILEKYCEKTISSDNKEKGEFYISTVLRTMLEDGLILKHVVIGNNDFTVLGTPYQVKLFASENRFQATPSRICFDLDNTLVSYPKTPGDYSTCEPLERNIRFLRKLKADGHTIIIYTARRMKTHGGNVGGVIADIADITIESLKKFEIPFDEIYFGKPYADFYIDDLAVNPVSSLEKETGFHESSIGERDFNSIITESFETITKSSTNQLAIAGEIHWFESIPPEVVSLFPKYFGSNGDSSYQLEKISGIPASRLFVDGLLTEELLMRIVNSIEEINSSIVDCPEGINIYANYSSKLEERYGKFDYEQFSDSDKIYDVLINELKEYEEKTLGTCCPIHGDPVLTNIIVKGNGDIKFIDMRGEIGGKLTIFGDKWYDFAKLYQSLTGYDEILLDSPTDVNKKIALIAKFEQYVTEKYGGDVMSRIKMIRNSLLFSLLPLHDIAKSHEFYRLLTSHILSNK